MDHSLPGCSIHGILQTIVLEWVAMPPPGDLPDSGIELVSLMSPALAGGFFATSATWEAHQAHSRCSINADSTNVSLEMFCPHLQKHLESYLVDCYDAIAVFLCIHIVLRFRNITAKRDVPALDRSLGCGP